MKTLIFDFDGTLADSFDLVVDIAHEVLKIPRVSDERMQEFRHMSVLKIAKELHISVAQGPRLLIKGRQMMHQRMSEVKTFPGLAEALAELHNAGYRLIVMSSNSEQNVRVFLRKNKLEKYFDEVYGGVGLLNKAAALRKIIKRNKYNFGDCYYVGDEARDVIASKKVGVKCVSVLWGYQSAKALEQQKPYAIATKPSDLPEIFGEEFAA